MQDFITCIADDFICIADWYDVAHLIHMLGAKGCDDAHKQSFHGCTNISLQYGAMLVVVRIHLTSPTCVALELRYSSSAALTRSGQTGRSSRHRHLPDFFGQQHFLGVLPPMPCPTSWS
jgi:hypothetical protein